MTVFIGNFAPDFTTKTVMPDNSIDSNFNLKNYLKGHKGILFFYPLDFTFVCPSEILAFNNRLGDFHSRNTKVVAVSVDSHFSHHAWKSMPINKGGIGDVQFPLVSDLSKEISKNYNVLSDESISFRGTFLIDENFKIRHYLVNDLPLGRNVDETIRMIDALDHHEAYGEVCPAGWKKGDQAMQASKQGVSDYLTSNAENL
jgi:peroxiredoxin (alkyl hydroperoxide reductase subunit C)